MGKQVEDKPVKYVCGFGVLPKIHSNRCHMTTNFEYKIVTLPKKIHNLITEPCDNWLIKYCKQNKCARGHLLMTV